MRWAVVKGILFRLDCVEIIGRDSENPSVSILYMTGGEKIRLTFEEFEAAREGFGFKDVLRLDGDSPAESPVPGKTPKKAAAKARKTGRSRG